MKILIVGCGSIGRRHARNSRKLGAELVLCDINGVLMRNLSAELGGVSCYEDYLKASEESGCKAAIIATPSCLHVEMATKLAKRGLHLLLEKPLSNSIEGTDQLIHVVQARQLTAMMAQSFRFHEGFLRLKGLLNENRIGKIYHVSLHTGWYLPDWHVHEDYRVEYSARRSLGGGVVLTNLSHTLDTFRWLFGEIEEIVGWKANLSSLEIDVEDSAFCLLRTKQGVIINHSSDFLSRLPRNDMKITGEEGHIEADFSNCQLKVWRIKEKRFSPKNVRVEDAPGRIRVLEDGVQYDPEPDIVRYSFEANHRYLAEMEYFFRRIRAGDVTFDLDLYSGLRVLELIMDPRLTNLRAD